MRNRGKARRSGVCAERAGSRLLRHRWRQGIPAFMALLSGCGSAQVLSSNLSQYADGTSLELVGSNIPGDPTGDRTVNVIPEVIVTSGGTDLMNGHKLRVNGGRVDYRTAEHEVPNRYLITWRGVRSSFSNTPTNIRIQDASERNAVVLRFEGNQLIVRTEDDGENPRPTFSLTRAHQVRIVVDMRGPSGSVTVHVSEEDNVLFDSPPLGLLDSEFSSLHTIQLESGTGATYFLQNLVASRLN